MEKSAQGGNRRRRAEKLIRFTFFGVALASIMTLALIVVFLFMEGLPIFSKASVKDFIFGSLWYPTDDPPEFGIFALIMGSVAVTIVSSVMSIPMGVLTALYLAEATFFRVRQWVKPVV